MTLTSRIRPARQLPEPARFWVGLAPRSWNSFDRFYSDLAGARLASPSGPAGDEPASLAQPEIPAEHQDELLYLPPVAPELAAARQELVAELKATGTPVLVQLLPGDEPLADAAANVFDLLQPLLERQLDSLAELAPGCGVVWPLISGLTDLPELWQEGCQRLARAEVGFVQPLTLELAPVLRRQLAEGCGDEVYAALFHGPVPSERSLAQVIHRHGLGVFMPRPDSGRSPRRVANRRVAAELAMIAELWSRLERPVGHGQAIFRAARGSDTTRFDLLAVAREHNLGVMDWLAADLVELVEEIVRDGRSRLLAELHDQYLTGA